MKLLLFLLCLGLTCHCFGEGLNQPVPCNDTNCRSCYYNDSKQDYCTQCYSSYFLDDKQGKCTNCSQVITNCSTCTYNSSAHQCTNCSYGYFINSPIECKACSDVVPSCSDCSLLKETQWEQTILAKSVKCHYCLDSKHPSEDGQQCRSCDMEVDYCYYCYKNQTEWVCSTCNFGYSLDDNQQQCNQWWVTTVIVLCCVCCGLPLFSKIGIVGVLHRDNEIRLGGSQQVVCSTKNQTQQMIDSMIFEAAIAYPMMSHNIHPPMIKCDYLDEVVTVETKLGREGSRIAFDLIGQSQHPKIVLCAAQIRYGDWTPPHKGNFNSWLFSQFIGRVCCLSYIVFPYMIHPLMTRKIILLFSLILLASCWELEALDEVPCTDKACVECDAETSTTCVRCYPSFYIDDINSKCTLCSDSILHCSQCQLNGTEVECFQCEAAYFVNAPRQCKLCSEAIPGCKICNPPIPTITTSLSRQLFDAKVQCDSCINNTWWPTVDGSACKECGQLIEHCIDCFKRRPSASLQCRSCEDGYEYDENMTNCKTCGFLIEHCTTCSRVPVDSTLQCDTCEDGYELNENKTKCEACGLLIEHCTTCSRLDTGSSLECGTCEEGYELNEDKTKCQEKSSSTAIIIISVVGGVVAIGAGFVAWKMCQKKKKLSTLLDQGDNEE